MGTEKYGRFYWLVTLDSGEQYIHADSVSLDHGCLVMNHNLDDHKSQTIFAPGKWLSCHPASVLDGDMVTVEHDLPIPKKPVATKKK